MLTDRQRQLVEQHAGLPARIAASIGARLPAHIDKDDLAGDGAIGLVLAARDFDQDRNVTFGAFAGYRIRGEIIDGLRRRNHTRRISHSDALPLLDTIEIEDSRADVASIVEQRERLVALAALPERLRIAFADTATATATLGVSESRVSQLRKRAREIMEGVPVSDRDEGTRATGGVLTRAELNVLALAAGGKTGRETAVILSKSVETVKSQRRSAIRKLGAREITNAVYIAMSRGLLEAAA